MECPEREAFALIDFGDGAELELVVGVLRPPVVLTLGFDDLDRAVGKVSAQVGEVDQRPVLPRHRDFDPMWLGEDADDGLVGVADFHQTHFMVGLVR